MPSRNVTSWMWGEAVDLLDRAERMHRQFFRLAASGSTCAVWEPPVDVFETEREIVVVVALPGVRAERIQITTESGVLILRAERRIPFTGSRGTVRQLEIPYGYFERRIQLAGVELESSTREYRDGCLILRLSKAEQI